MAVSLYDGWIKELTVFVCVFAVVMVKPFFTTHH